LFYPYILAKVPGVAREIFLSNFEINRRLMGKKQFFKNFFVGKIEFF